jgi:hypothetical protein
MNETEEFVDKKGFFYIVSTADVPTNVYKIGKTCATDPNKRLCRYPVYTTVKYTIAVENADLFEDLIMRKFKSIFKRRMEFGIEYYEGDIVCMINSVHNLWLKYGQIKEAELDKSIEKIKPNGWQYFVNEWLSNNIDANAEEAYCAYVTIMETVFGSNEYAEIEPFTSYFEAVKI